MIYHYHLETNLLFEQCTNYKCISSKTDTFSSIKVSSKTQQKLLSKQNNLRTFNTGESHC